MIMGTQGSRRKRTAHAGQKTLVPAGARTLGLVLVGFLVCVPVASAGGGAVALQAADASCADDSRDRYVDCGNGTVTDNDTGLVWLADASCLSSAVDWFTARELVAGLSDLQGDNPDDCGLEDGSSPGEWRLPSVAEWDAMVAEAKFPLFCSSPTISNDAGTACWSEECVTTGGCSFTDVLSSFYWSSTTVLSSLTNAWAVGLAAGNFLGGPAKIHSSHVWPVRGGQ